MNDWTRGIVECHEPLGSDIVIYLVISTKKGILELSKIAVFLTKKLEIFEPKNLKHLPISNSNASSFPFYTAYSDKHNLS